MLCVCKCPWKPSVTSTGADNTAEYKHLCVNAGTFFSSSEETVGLLNDSAISLVQHCSIYRVYLFVICYTLLLEFIVHVIKKTTSKKCV